MKKSNNRLVGRWKIRGRSVDVGFTLIEVIIALGVFAFAISILLGLFLRGMARLRDMEERANVSRLIPSVNAKLKEIGWDESTNRGSPGVIELTRNEAMLFVANVDASWVSLYDEANELAKDDQYYLISLERYDERGYRYGTDLRGVIVLKSRISWPYRTPATGDAGYVETAEEDRKQFEFLSTVRP